MHEHEGRAGGLILWAKSFAFPFDEQLKERLDGMFLQDIADTSFILDSQLRPNFRPNYFSGDTLDCASARSIYGQFADSCRIDLSDRRLGKMYFLFTVTSDGHDPFSTFNYSLWDQWLMIHNQPIHKRLWSSRAFLLKLTCGGQEGHKLKFALGVLLLLVAHHVHCGCEDWASAAFRYKC